MNENQKGPETSNLCPGCGKDHAAEIRDAMKNETPERAARRETLRRALELAFDEALAAVKNPFRVDAVSHGVAADLQNMLSVSQDRTPDELLRLGSEVASQGLKMAILRMTVQGQCDPMAPMLSLLVGQAFAAVGTRWGMQ